MKHKSWTKTSLATIIASCQWPKKWQLQHRKRVSNKAPWWWGWVRQQEKQRPFAGASHWWTSRCVSAEWRNDGIKKSKEDNMFSKDLLLVIRGPLQLFLCTMHYLWPLQCWHPAICLLSERGCRERIFDSVFWAGLNERTREKEKLEKNVDRKIKKRKRVTIDHGWLELVNLTLREPNALGNYLQIPMDLEEGMLWG